MASIEYVLLAILGSTTIAPGSSGNVSPRSYGAESVPQPSGSAPAEARYSRANKSLQLQQEDHDRQQECQEG